MSDRVDYSAAIVTFRRAESLRIVLDGLATQTHPPSLIVVADCDPDATARPVVDEFDARVSNPVVYEPLGENLGPAGGWAGAVERAASHPDRGEWVGVFDDDDPLTDREVMAKLARQAAGYGDNPNVAGLGLRGSTLVRNRARLQRVLDPDAPVDYLASNGAPIYRWTAIESVGFFDPSFFFGFEDLDLGLRLRKSGRTLHLLRSTTNHVVSDTAPDRSPWREYYKTRAMVAICRKHVGPAAVAAFVGRSVLAGSALLVAQHHNISLAQARILGTIDALAGRMGIRRYHPSENPAKRRRGD